MKITKWLQSLVARIIDIQSRIHKIQEALGRIESRQSVTPWNGRLAAREFRTFSQWGEDGIIQALIHTVEIRQKIFIEFGVTNYTESNTRFLLMNNNWKGLLIDGNAAHIEYIKNDPIYWQHNLKADCTFITRENINEIFRSNGVSGEIGLLSIDIDGNDYWVWKEITAVNPAIVVVEFNARFGKDRAVTVPYDPAFTREKAHYSNIYYGASLKALSRLGCEKGYAFVGANSAGNNAFFVRRDLMTPPLREMTVEEGYTKNQFRESRSPDGSLAFLTYEQECALVEKLPLVEIA
jgi:hypothetical protein